LGALSYNLQKNYITQNYVYTYKNLQVYVLIVVCHEE